MRPTAAIVFVAVLAGCGGDRSESVPAPCSGSSAIAGALGSAPGAVRMRGVAISECFNRDASGSDVQVVGATLLPVAQDLGERAADDPEGDEALQLGYLIGAARRGAARNGVAAELVRRLEQEAGELPGRSDAYRRGLSAGRATG